MNQNNYFNIDGNGSTPLRTPIGLQYGDGAVSENSAPPFIDMSPNFTVTFWVYLLTTHSPTYLISKVSHIAQISFSTIQRKTQHT